MNRRGFTDMAGYTRHCWECRHAKGWSRHKVSRKVDIEWHVATCELTGLTVEKFDSPDNQCSHLPSECDWSEA